jgi:predicted nucleic acid-binding protein
VIRAVLDTNTLASASIAKSGPIAALLDAWRARRVGVVISQHIIAELERTLRKPYFAARVDADSR